MVAYAGLTKNFASLYEISSDPTEAAFMINGMGRNKLWQDESPIWARPQDGHQEAWPVGVLQVVGHTPVARPFLKKGFLTLDTFSTYPDGSHIGNCEFMYLDTETGKYEGIKAEDSIPT